MHLSIKEVSEQLGISAYTIRYYEKEGLLPFLKRNNQGNRIFLDPDVKWLNLMTCFRSTGMPISSLKTMVELALEGDSTVDQRKEILENHKLELERRQKELDKAFHAVNEKLSLYDDVEKHVLETIEKSRSKKEN